MNKNYQKDLRLLSNILDSKLIVTTKKSLYNIKLIECGNYIQIYFYDDFKIKNTKKDDFDLNLKKINTSILEDECSNRKQKLILKNSNEIEEKNIIRSKLKCQRLAKSNIFDWQTFITLTFDPKKAIKPMNNIANANKRFRYFVDKIQRIKKDFKYICVPEFHKSGIVHYHLLCNIKIDDSSLIYSQENNPKFKHIKYWIDGFTSVELIKGDPKKIIGYIAKYMTKDIDNRLFNRHRYFYSRNLNKPKESYIDLNNEKEKNYYLKKIQEKSLIYQSEYLNSFDNTKVIYLELN